ncbi:MAG: MBOAT family protein [Bacteroidales bacterium]|nr:MBOAT family protein [Bacteroidales bacterium]
MLFNSIQFALFLPIVFLLYWFVFDRFISKSKWQLRLQNAFVVVASYVFYGWWDWRFLLLIAFTSFCSWGSGMLMQRVENQQIDMNLTGGGKSLEINKLQRRKKLITTANIVLNLLILAIFKYYDFFVTEFAQLFHISTEGLLLKVILPVGISFYTFQALSYSIDVYRGKIEPTKDIIAFFAFISFFPQLVAGPIERATNLLPQFLKKREFDYDTAVDGMRQILWGLFKKIVVADNCAVYVDQVFSSYTEQTGSTLLLAAIFFTFQIYGDFSGYSDIAIGTAKLFGIKLMRNFNVPYFSRDIAEFWRRWHISLTTWFRDYVYIPLGGSRVSKAKVVRNTFIIFLLSGFWHGANWTFIAWGAYHAILFLPLILTGKNRKYTNQIAEGRLLPTIKETGQMLLTFFLAVVGWIIFRAPGMPTVLHYLQGMCQFGTLRASYRFFTLPEMWPTNLFIVVMLVVEWFQRGKEHGMSKNVKLHRVQNDYVLAVIYALLLVLFILFGGQLTSFIYFQF